MKTFNYESNCVKYKNCFFDLGEYEKGKLSLAIYGHVEDDKNLSHISNVTVNVEEKLEENQVVIDNYANSNLISFLLDLGIVKNMHTSMNGFTLSDPMYGFIVAKSVSKPAILLLPT